MAAWVLESAHRYARASAILLEAHLMYESEVNAALSMELLIKSLLARPVENARRGTVAQQYSSRHIKVPGGHDLFKLYENVDPDVAAKVGLRHHADILESKRNIFMSLRYVYEEGAPGGTSDLLLRAVSFIIPQVVHHLIETGDDDKWLLYMKQNPQDLVIG